MGAALMVGGAVAGVAHACPGCKEALFDPQQLPQRLRAAQGYAWSIAALLLVPAAMIGGLVGWIVFSQRRLARKAANADSVDRDTLSG